VGASRLRVNQLIFIMERKPVLTEVGSQIFRKILMKVRKIVSAERNAEKTLVKTSKTLKTAVNWVISVISVFHTFRVPYICIFCLVLL
jgi:hypothetical protein